jgi:large subunit ribosomal protein L18
VQGSATRPRLAVSRTTRNIQAQLIDDLAGKTLVAATSLEGDVKGTAGPGAGGNIEGAKAVGKLIAERAKQAGIVKVVFDRGGFAYHGRVAALADAARHEGLEF